jgi:hypothetical protein
MKKIYFHNPLYPGLISLLILLFSGAAQSQSLIYGISGGHLVSLDYRSAAYNVIPTSITFPNPNTSFGCAIDQYNGRYFYDPAPLSGSGVIRYIDLNTYTTGVTCSFEYKNWIEYNSLNNSLLFEAIDGDFYSYSFENSVLTHLSTLPPSAGIIYGETRVYNPVNNTLFFQRYNDSISYDIIDGFTGALLHTHVTHHGMIESAVVDYQTGIYYGILHDTIIHFDPLTDEVTHVVALPIHMVHLNNQMAVYDQDSAKYIIPTYKNSNNKAFYMVADVKKHCIDTVFEQPDMNMDWQRIYSKPQTLLTRISDSLFCPMGITCRWLFNNDTIAGVFSSSYKPTQSGLYKTLAQYPGYPSVSKDFNYAMTSVPEVPGSADVRLYPDPVGDLIYYDISCKSKSSDNVSHIEIIDNLGKIVFSAEQEDPMYKGSVNLRSLPAGFYIIRIRLQNFMVTKGFLHK